MPQSRANDAFETHSSKVQYGSYQPPPAHAGPADNSALSASLALPAHPSMPPSDHAAFVNHDLANDPFLTHNKAPVPSAGVAQPMRSVADDAFMLPAPVAPPRPQPQPNYYQTHKPVSYDDSRRAQAIYTYIPWLCFVWMLLVWLVLRHFAPLTAVVVTAFVVAVGFMIASGFYFVPTSSGTTSFVFLGLLVAAFSIAGVCSGAHGWSLAMRQYWWLSTGYGFQLQDTGETPAAARGDAAWIDFKDEAKERTWNNTAVDNSRSAGFRKGGTMFCAAPILTPAMSSAGLPRVEYWAIGMDCCQTLGGFTCDASSVWNGGVAVPMLLGGFPCAGCNSEFFDAAIRKAEDAHDVVSAEGALRVRWVVDVQVVSTDLLYLVGFHIFTHCFVAFVAALVAGVVLVRHGAQKSA